MSTAVAGRMLMGGWLFAATPLVLAAQGQQASGTVPATATVYFPTLGLTVNVDNDIQWSVVPRDVGGGRMADVVTARQGAGSFSFVVIPAENADRHCGELMRNALSQPGAHSVAAPNYAPTPLDAPIVEAANGVALFCLRLRDRATVFSLHPTRMTTAQHFSLRLMALLMSVARPQQGTIAAGSHNPMLAMLTGSLRLHVLPLTLPMLPNHSWTATAHVGSTGVRYDAITRTRTDGARQTVLVTRLDDTSTACDAAVNALTNGGGSVVAAPDWVPSDWHPRTGIKNNGTLACLPLAHGVLLASVSDVGTDSTVVYALLSGLRAAAVNAWGTP